MLQTLFGLILLLCPLLLILRCEDKKSAFARILSFVIAGHLSAALLTQAFGIFRYPLIAAVHIFVSLGVLFVIRKDIKGIFNQGKRLWRGIDWALVSVLVIAFIHLYPVHYNYSGKYSVVTTEQYQDIENMRYPYPYFADEWYAVALIKDVISSGSLPLRNPLVQGHPPFLNLEFAFHSFLSELMLLLHLDPLTQYVNLTIGTGILICALVYIFLRFDGAARLPSALAASAVLYITNSANLPGVWNLIPLILGIISMLLSFSFFSSSDIKMVFMMGLLTLLFYPPLAPFYVLAVIFCFGGMKALSWAQRVRVVSGLFAAAVFAGGILALSFRLGGKEVENFVRDLLLPKIFPHPFPPDATPHFAIWNVLPAPVLIFSILGIGSIVREKTWLAGAVVLGLVYWAVYAVSSFRFFLDYERVVVFTSILLTLIAGYGLDYFVRILKGITVFRKNNSLSYIQALVLVFLLFSSTVYAGRDVWQKLTLSHRGLNKIFHPAAPANRYLHPDDLRIFKEIKGKRFVSAPWKGTVIGVATGNYPVVMKPGTISGGKVRFGLFMNKDCLEKYRKTIGRGVQYVYFPPFSCPQFKFVDKSEEGFYLYKVVE